MQVLENERFRVTINELGAELTSIVGKSDGAEYVWQADPAVWARHAPMLFPIVGRLKDKRYTARGAEHTITQHGFARDLPFAACRESGAAVTLTLRQNDYTKSMYPWDFTLIVRYVLDGATLKKEHTVINDSGETMYYELGGHDAYTLCPAGEDAGYYAEFEGAGVLHPVLMDENVFLSREHGIVELTDGCLALTRQAFANDTIILDDLAVRRVTLACRKNSKRIKMDFADFPYFALWSADKDIPVPYVCLEPWSALPDGGYLDHALENKVGVRALAPGAKDRLSYAITISE